MTFTDKWLILILIIHLLLATLLDFEVITSGMFTIGVFMNLLLAGYILLNMKY